MTASRFQIQHLPKGDTSNTDFQDNVARYKAFRLQSLKLSPQTFASTYEREFDFKDTIWQSRLQNPLANIFVASDGTIDGKDPSSVEDTPAVKQPWLGVIIMLGPIAKQEGHLTVAGSDPWTSITSEDARRGYLERPKTGDTAHFHFNGLYTLPAVRGLGLGHRLIQTAQSFAMKLAKEQGADTTRFTIIVDSDNPIPKHLYEKSGFHVIGENEYLIPKVGMDWYEAREAANEAMIKKVALTMEHRASIV